MITHPATLLTDHMFARPCVTLLGGPFVTLAGEPIDVPEGSKRLLAYVCLSQGPVERRRAAGTLWPFGDDVRAAGNLRSALWRLKGSGIDVLESDKLSLWLRPGTTVDVELLDDWADRLIRGHPRPTDLDVVRWHADFLELLPGWYDDWALFERERLRQVLLHALEALARQLSARQRHAEAVSVAMAAVSVEPLRESAQCVLVECHLGEGNVAEARRAYGAYRDIARRELGVAPGTRMQSLVSDAAAVEDGPAAEVRDRPTGRRYTVRALVEGTE